MTGKEGLVETYPALRFLCRSRWRCLLCNSPWFAASTDGRARERLFAHLKAGCP